MRLSVIIPVYNEQDRINSIIAGLREQGDFEIIVSDCNDATNKVIIDKDVIQVSSPAGRGFQMNAGAEKSSGDMLLFLHADTCLETGFHKEIEGHSAGAFQLKIDSPEWYFRIIEKSVRIRNSITGTPYGDQALFCSREVFEQVGGFADIPLMEDVKLMRDIRKNGIQIHLSDMKAITSARRWKKKDWSIQH